MLVMEDLYQFVQQRLRSMPVKEWEAVAKEADVNHATVYRYAYGRTPNPSYPKLCKIVAAIKARDGTQ